MIGQFNFKPKLSKVKVAVLQIRNQAGSHFFKAPFDLDPQHSSGGHIFVKYFCWSEILLAVSIVLLYYIRVSKFQNRNENKINLIRKLHNIFSVFFL